MLGRILRKIYTSVFKFFNPGFSQAVLYDVPKVYFKNKLKLGRKVHINDEVFINAVGKVSIGDYTTISHGVSIISTKNDIKKWRLRIEDEDLHIDEPITIGKNVWLCANVIVLGGVNIPDNCVIAAGSVVTKSLDKGNAVYAGSPAKYVKML